MAREFLSNLNCEITLAGNGLEAIAALEAASFDIVLMDCQMPEMDGLEDTRRIRDNDKIRKAAPIPIVAVTAHAYEEDRAQCMAAGMDDHLAKPFTEDQLAQVLCTWVGRRASNPVLQTR